MLSSIWICPTRSRPANLQRLVEAWAQTGAEAALAVAIDSDDPADYGSVVMPEGLSVTVHVDDRERLGPTLNRLAVHYANLYDTVGFLGDDHIPRTPGFDRILHDAIMEQGGGLAYGNDLLQGENLATAVLQDSHIIRTLGYFCPPGQTHLYLDDYWMAMGRALGKLTYRPDVIIEHAHYIAGKAPVDALYAEVNSPQMYSDDAAAYAEYTRTRFAGAVAAVQNG